jgi:hypothetical protein
MAALADQLARLIGALGQGLNSLRAVSLFGLEWRRLISAGCASSQRDWDAGVTDDGGIDKFARGARRRLDDRHGRRDHKRGEDEFVKP